jgi:hypothetical protein
LVQLNGKWGYIDKSGKIVIAPQYDYAFDFRGDLTAVKMNGKWGFIDKTGKMVIAPQFDKTGGFTKKGFALVKMNDKWGFIDKTGKIVIEPRFELFADGDETTFYDGVAKVKVEGKWGLIDETGQWVARPVFRYISHYWPKQKIVKSDGYYYDVEGKKLEHYVNHMEDGYRAMKNKDYTVAIASFQAALRINPDDEAALYGLQQVQ